MRSRTLMLLLVAMVCGLGAAIMAYQLLPANQPQGQTEEVWVAAKDVHRGTVLKEPETWFKKRREKKEDVPPNAVRDIAKLKDKQVRSVVPQGVVLTDYHMGKQLGLHLQLKPGHRAFALPANVNKDAGGFILPNSIVDIICTTQEGERARSLTILQNVLVLAVNQMDESPDQGGTVVPNNVTLSVTPEQAQLLSLALSKGQLQLTLRNPTDTEDVKSVATTNLWQTPNPQGSSGQPQADLVQVLVAAKDIDRNTMVTNPDDLFKFVSCPRDLAPDAALRDKDLFSKQEVKTNAKIVAGQFVMRDNFVDKNHQELVKDEPKRPEELFLQEIWNGPNKELRTYNQKNRSVPTPDVGKPN